MGALPGRGPRGYPGLGAQPGRLPGPRSPGDHVAPDVLAVVLVIRKLPIQHSNGGGVNWYAHVTLTSLSLARGVRRQVDVLFDLF